MKLTIVKTSLLILIFTFQVLSGQDFSGQFHTQVEGGRITLTLEQDQQGGYSGTLVGSGLSYQITAQVQDGILIGAVGDEWEGILFQAQLNGGKLNFTMAEMDDYGNPDRTTAQTFVFHREPPQSQDKGKKKEASEEVIINKTALTKEQIAELERTYGIKPRPGNYWYDARSGLYGVVGHQAYGFMLPNHNFGTLSRGASNGDTGVLINGREIPLAEYTVWSYMVGSWIQPGSYWLDHTGNAGYEGNPMPVINLYQAAQQRAYSGQGGSGDNFWSSRFSAGNYDSGNTRGYVSVPGYGPVGYGF